LSRSSSEGRTASAEANILEKLNIIYQEFQDGKRAVPAFSRVTVQDLDRDDEETWKAITTDLEDVGVDTKSISANHNLIRHWIDQVILEDTAENEYPSENLGINSQSSSRAASIGHPDESERVIGHATRGTAELTFEPSSIIRSTSISSHRSKASTWRPMDQPNLPYAHGLLAKLLNLEYAPKGDNDIVLLPIKRIYHQLDWLDRGFLLKSDVERHCVAAVAKSNLSLSDEKIREFVNSVDANRDSRVDRVEFIALCYKLIDFAARADNERQERAIKQAQINGKEEALLECRWLLENKPERIFLPWGWRFETEAGSYYLNSIQDRTTHVRPDLELGSFSGMAFLAAVVWIPRISQSEESWGTQLSSLSKEIRNEYQSAFETVLDAALNFSALESESGVIVPTDLDQIFETLNSIPDGKTFPCFTKLKGVQQSCQSMLSSINGFVFGLKNIKLAISFSPGDRYGHEIGKDGRFCAETLPDLTDWRALRMSALAKRIGQEASSWGQIREDINWCRGWWKDNPTVITGAQENWANVHRLKHLWQSSSRPGKQVPISKSKPETTTIEVTIVAADGLYKRDRFGTFVPK
jgi:hypothetical protein